MTQSCHVPNFQRVRKHEALINHVTRSLNQRDIIVHRQRSYNTLNGVLKFDTIAYSMDNVFVTGAQVINDQFPLEKAHRNKVEKHQLLMSQLNDLHPGGLDITLLTLN